MRAVAAMALAGFLELAACAPVASTAPTTAPSVAPSVPVSTAPTGPAASQSAVVLHQAPAVGYPPCDSIGVDNPAHSVTFQIDPEAAEQVTALTDTGVTFTTYWSAGFQPGTATERVIRDPAGNVVVTDGDVLPLPEAADPRLHDYLVLLCNGSNWLFVFLTDPVD
jgi:hypothetical protein